MCPTAEEVWQRGERGMGGCWCQAEDYQGLAAGQILTPLFAVRIQHTYYIHHIDNKQEQT